MKIATAPTRSSKRWKTTDVSWDWLLDKLRQPKRTGETMAEYQRMTRDEQSARKDVGGFVGGSLNGGRRVASAVTERWLLTLDADHARADDWEEVTGLYDWRMCVYSTHSHTPQRPRLRWIIPLKRAVSPEEYQACARMMASLIGIETMDSTTYQPERLMYWPSCPDDAEYVFHEQDGMTLRPEELLRMYGPGDAWRDVELWPMAESEKEIVVREAKRQGDPTGKPGIVGRFCRAFDVYDVIDRWLSDVYEPCETCGPGRYTYTAGSTAGGAVVYEDGKFLYSHHSTDPAGGQLLNAFDLVRVHKFGALDDGRRGLDDTSPSSWPSYKAMCEMIAEDDECKRAFFSERMAEMQEEFGDLGEWEQERPEQVAPEHGDKGANKAAVNTGKSASFSDSPSKNVHEEPDMSWVEQLEVNKKTGEADPTIENAVLILDHDPRLAGKVALNEFSGRPTVRGSLPWRNAKDGDLWKDSDEANLRLYMEKFWKFKGRDKINDALAVVLEKNGYHPVREYLEGLKWDGVERLDTCIIRYLETDDNDYVRAVTRKWMTAAVKRVMEPGCKFDSMLLIQGKQEIGKSHFCHIISKRESWFTDSMFRMDGKDAFDAVRGKWIVEIAELAAAKKSEQESQKQFLTAQYDSYRPAYGKNSVDFPRQCVFFGTTNDPEPLKDDTGGRRYWLVRSHKTTQGTLTGLADEVDQLWAEAVVRYRAGETLWLDKAELNFMAKEIQAANTYYDDWTGIIEEFLDKPITPDWETKTPEERRAWIHGDSLEQWDELDLVRREIVSIPEIRVECFGEDRAGIRSGFDGTSRRIGRILGLMPGWERQDDRIKVGDYGRQRVYQRRARKG